MNRLQTALARLAEVLTELNRHWALVGGLAVSAQAEPRFTRDIDVAVAVADDADAERLVHALTLRGFSIRATIEQTRASRLATIRLGAPASPRRGIVVDLLFASSGIEDLIVAEAERLEVIPGLTVPVARIGHLLATKLLARDDTSRPQDAADLAMLLAESNEAERARAVAALTEITRRGFHRGRDLMAAWDRLAGR